MQRFTALWGEQRMALAPDGHWVQFPDAQSALLAKDGEIAALKEHIITLCECIETDPQCKDDYTYQTEAARQALSRDKLT